MDSKSYPGLKKPATVFRKGARFIKPIFIAGLIAAKTILATLFIHPQAAQAVDRTAFLQDLKHTFNSPVSSKLSPAAIVFIIAVIAFLWLGIHLDTVKTEKKRRQARQDYQEKRRIQMASSHQKRKWFRVKIGAEILWEPVKKEDYLEEEEFQKDKLIDVSGGGLCFSTTAQLKADDKIRLLLPLNKKQSIPLNGQVVRVTENGAANLISIKFLDIRDSQRDKIISALISIQRNTIKEEKEKADEIEAGQARENPSPAAEPPNPGATQTMPGLEQNKGM